MFSTDQPISSKKEDLLGRHPFAKHLAEAILNYKQKESISIGLCGEWGTGKTSIINMALHDIKLASTPKKTFIIKFNPWNFSEQNQLIKQFFNKLSSVLNRKDNSEKYIKIGNTIQKYALFFESLALASTEIGSAAKAIKSVGIAAEKAGEEESKSFSGVKKDLDKLLENIDTKLIIVIDDIDRLNNTEIRQIFQLVKSLADFPNTIYLLSFDKKVVANALKNDSYSGNSYLEKIIQVSFDIPQVSKPDVDNFLSPKLLNEFDIPNNEHWNKEYWDMIYDTGITCLFNNLRDVYRYLNTFNFSFELVKDEVNPVDFIAITALQVFRPELYNYIKNNKSFFTMSSQDEDKTKYILKQIAKLSSDDDLEYLMQLLFPVLNNEFKPELWRKQARICSHDIFDTYFKLSIPSNGISLIEIKHVLSKGDNVQAFTNELLRLDKVDKIEPFLRRVLDYIKEDESIPETNIPSIVKALINIGDQLNVDSSFIEKICIDLIQRIQNPDKQFKILKNAIINAKQSLYTITSIITKQCQVHGKYGFEEKQQSENVITTPKQLDRLLKITETKIKEWEVNGWLAKSKHRDFILRERSQWRPKLTKKYIKQLVEDDRELAKFITLNDDNVDMEKYRTNYKYIEHIAYINPIIKRLKKIKTQPLFEELEKEQQFAIDAFLEIHNS